MRKLTFVAVVLLGLVLLLPSFTSAQVTGMVGGKMGLGLFDGNAAFLIGPGGEIIFKKNLAVATELNIGTSTGTPVEWATYFKYLISISGTKIRPYADGGISLAFWTGGPYFGLRFGGGALIPIAKDLYAMGDMQLGPTFGGGSAGFFLSITGGIRYEIR